MPARKYAKPNGKGNQGPKPKFYDEQQIHDLAQIGCTPEEIAAIISPPGTSKCLPVSNLEKKFCATMQKGRMKLHRSLKHELVERALNGNTAALIFALKAYCRLSDSNSDTSERQHISIHFDYGQAKSIEERAVPIREAVTNMLSNYRKDVAHDLDSDTQPSQPPQPEKLALEDQP